MNQRETEVLGLELGSRDIDTQINIYAFVGRSDKLLAGHGPGVLDADGWWADPLELNCDQYVGGASAEFDIPVRGPGRC
jgi:hypothetical protein